MNEDYGEWIGRSEERADVLEAARSNALTVMLGGDGLAAGDVLPPLHHWLYFWNIVGSGALGADGHPAKGGAIKGEGSKGGFLPPIPLPRRMWAGGRLQFHRDLHLGERVTKTSTIQDITKKEGRSGTLIFVTLRHEISGEAGLAISEAQDLVYRAAAPKIAESKIANSKIANSKITDSKVAGTEITTPEPSGPETTAPETTGPETNGRETNGRETNGRETNGRETSAPPKGQQKSPSGSPTFSDQESPWRDKFWPDEVALFRYSALTMNGHRIHYDRPYAIEEEAYPALVVHGPLQATLLARMAAREGGKLSHFNFRGLAPAFDGQILQICGKPQNTSADTSADTGADGGAIGGAIGERGASLWTAQQGGMCMRAEASFD